MNHGVEESICDIHVCIMKGCSKKENNRDEGRQRCCPQTFGDLQINTEPLIHLWKNKHQNQGESIQLSRLENN